MKRYTIDIEEECGKYIVSGGNNKVGFCTSGKTLEEAFDNLADAMKTTEGVKMSWWNKLLDKLKIYSSRD